MRALLAAYRKQELSLQFPAFVPPNLDLHTCSLDRCSLTLCTDRMVISTESEVPILQKQ